MNPLRIRARSYRTFEALDLDLPEGCVAVVGSNGAGKSSIVNVIDLALFGPETRSLGDYLTRGGADTEMEIELTFEHGGELYRVRRHFSARGKGQTKLDLERLDDDVEEELDEDGERTGDRYLVGETWTPLTCESQKETQAAIERLLGLSRETFRASAFLAQGDGAAFSEAKPADRKRILADVLGLDIWEQLLERLRADKRAAEKSIAETAGRIATLTDTAGDPDAIQGELETAREIHTDAQRERAAAEKQLEQATVRAQEIEQAHTAWQARQAALAAARDRLAAHERIQADADQARAQAAAAEQALAALPGDDIAELEQRERDIAAAVEQHRQAVADRERIARERDLAERQQAAIAADAQQRRRKIADTEQRIQHLEQAGPGDERCDTCRQILGQEALEATLSTLRAQIVTLADEARALEEQAAAITLPDIPAEPAPPTVDDVTAADALAAVRATLQTARAAATERARLTERLDGLRERIAAAELPEYLAELDERRRNLQEAQTALAAVEQPEPGALDMARQAALTARARIEEERIRHDQAAAQIARLEERLAHARQAADAIAEARAQRETLQADLDELTVLERAYGRDGIPALIVEQAAIPQIETEACRILAELGTSYRVELRTQAALKSGDGLRDTLDVVVIDDTGEAPYESFSGGERTRINLALRLALAELLAHRRGAESRLLAIDEPEFLDEAGTMRLADVLRGLHAAGKFDRIALVSHVPTLRDAFDQTIEISKENGISRVIA